MSMVFFILLYVYDDGHLFFRVQHKRGLQYYMPMVLFIQLYVYNDSYLFFRLAAQKRIRKLDAYGSLHYIICP
jgi:hypothetical protein